MKSILAIALLALGVGCSTGPAIMATYMGTPPVVTRAMLDLAQVGPNDVVYDLGSGDGRIVILAAKEYGARGVGFEIDPQLIAQSRENARKAGVEDKVQFIQGDLFQADLKPATVVTLYLFDTLNMKLRPKLLRELNPGARVVSHQWKMGDWQPDKEKAVEDTWIYLWRIRTTSGHTNRERAPGSES